MKWKRKALRLSQLVVFADLQLFMEQLPNARVCLGRD